MSPKDEIERLRKEMLVGSKRGNRFLEGFSTSAVILHSVTLPQLWHRLIEDDQRLRVTSGVPVPVVAKGSDDTIDDWIEDGELKPEDLDTSVPVGPSIEETTIEEHFVEVSNTVEALRSVQTASSLSSVKRLLRKANEGLEERGFNFLNLCVGKVHWKDEQHEGEAPALLIPVRFLQTAVRLGISIEFADEMIQWNPALLEKLRTQLPKDTIRRSCLQISLSILEDIQAGWVY